MRFRLLRSRAFWFGVPGLVFLLWLWGDSKDHVTSLTFHGKPGIHFRQRPAGMRLILWENSNHSGNPRFGAERILIEDDYAATRAELLEQIDLAWVVDQDRSYLISLPYWKLLAGYLLLWAAVLIWRWRKYAAAFRAEDAG